MKKKFPSKSAFVSCSVGCKTTSCKYGCISCSRCVNSCKFGAINIGEGGIAVVDKTKCVACGACVKACPKKIIHILLDDSFIKICCSNHDKGAEAKNACPSSCIACSICERVCTANAVVIIDNLALIDEERCLSCGLCLVKCPRGVIQDTRGVL